MYQFILLHSCDYLQKTSIKINVTTGKCKQLKWNVALNRRWNSSSCRKLSLSESWTQGLVADSVREFEWKSLVMDSNSTQPTFLLVLRRICQCWIPYVAAHSATLMWLTTKTLIKSNLETEKQPKWNIKLNKGLNLSRCTKLAVNASWNLGMIAPSVSLSDWNSVVMWSNPTQANFL